MPGSIKFARTVWAASAVLATIALQATGQGGPPPAPVRLDAVRQEVAEHQQRVTGELRAARQSALASEASGRVAELLVVEGQAVSEGDVIAKLDATFIKLDKEEAAALEAARTALVDVRRAEAEKAKLDYDRAATLLNTSSAGSKAEVDRTRTEVQAANARVRAAEAERDQATILKERASQAEADMTVLAPFDGVVVRKRTEVGEWVRPGDPVVDLLDLDQIDVWLDVPERWLGRLNDEETELKIDVPATGDQFTVTGAAIVPLADALSRLFPVRVRMQNPKRRLKPGMRVSGFVPTGEKRPVLTVHKDAILRDDAGAFVYFAAGTTAAVARIEPLYATSRTRMAVRAQGLQAGSQVVTEGNERLFPGRALSSPDLAAPGPER